MDLKMFLHVHIVIDFWVILYTVVIHEDRVLSKSEAYLFEVLTRKTDFFFVIALNNWVQTKLGVTWKDYGLTKCQSYLSDLPLGKHESFVIALV